MRNPKKQRSTITLAVSLSLFLLVNLMSLPHAYAGKDDAPGQNKDKDKDKDNVLLCHLKGNGDYKALYLSVDDALAHKENHGDLDFFPLDGDCDKTNDCDLGNQTDVANLLFNALRELEPLENQNWTDATCTPSAPDFVWLSVNSTNDGSQTLEYLPSSYVRRVIEEQLLTTTPEQCYLTLCPTTN